MSDLFSDILAVASADTVLARELDRFVDYMESVPEGANKQLVSPSLNPRAFALVDSWDYALLNISTLIRREQERDDFTWTDIIDYAKRHAIASKSPEWTKDSTLRSQIANLLGSSLLPSALLRGDSERGDQ